MAKFFRRNDRIRAQNIRLVDSEDNQVGLIAIEKALQMAKEANLDLVEVAPNAKPPVCKIMDFGKFLYKQKKNDAKQKKASKTREVKGIRLSMRTDIGDLKIKASKAIEFLKEKNPVKVSLIMKGREMAHQEIGHEKMEEFAKLIAEHGAIEQNAKKTGHTLTMMFKPK